MKIINYFLYFLRKRSIILKYLVKYQAYLLNGTYVIRPNIGYLDSNRSFISIKISFFLKLIFFQKVKIYSEKKIFTAHTILINAQGYPKFLSNSQVLTLSNKKEIKKMLETYSVIKKFFQYPRLIDIREDYYIEEFIDGGMPKVEEVFKILINFYKSQTAQYNKNKVNFFKGEYSSLYIYSHNDIHLKNIIKNDKLYFIDWEYYGPNIFYYDFINLLFVPALEGDYSFLKNYFLGVYDKLFEELFIEFNLSFDNKILYVHTYLNSRIEIIDKNNKRVNMYREILKCVEL